MLAKIEGVNYTAILGESAKIDVKQAVNYIKSGQAEISETVGDIISEFNDNAVEKTNTFNQNAIDKMSEFDLNASNKTGDFNTNATNKTTNYNDNATSKTGAFDSNAVDKTNDFNNNATAKTTNFDDNYTEKKNLIDAEVSKSKTWAEGTDSEVTPLGGTHSSKGWAEIAEAAASGVQNPANRDLSNLTADGQMIIDSQNGTISNCILEIPQNIKLELSGGTFTLKSGSILVNTGETYSTFTLTSDSTQTYNVGNFPYDKRYYLTTYGKMNIAQKSVDDVYSGNSLPASLPNNGDWFYLTTDKKIYTWNSTTEQFTASAYRYPIAIFYRKNATEFAFVKDSNGNDMIFNGAGFIGHHAFVYPNVEALIPDGFNDDGSLNSINIESQSLLILELRVKNNDICAITSSSAINLWEFGYEEATDEETADFSTMYKRIYIKNENLIKLRTENGIIVAVGTVFFEYTYDGTTVTDFTIRQPYEGAANLLTKDIKEEVATKQVDVTTLTGYDSTQTQTLKNINGVLTWVTD